VKKKPHQKAISQTPFAEYGGLIGGIAELLEAARRTGARTINALMTATYWEIGRRIVEFEQGGCYPRNFTLIARTPVLAPATLAALRPTRAIPNRDVFYVASPSRSILPSDFSLCLGQSTLNNQLFTFNTASHWENLS
jgi:hypothetical protein